jgi:ABC-type sugar transport system substrate-binding protein
MVTGRAGYRSDGVRAIRSLAAPGAILAVAGCKPAGDSVDSRAPASSGPHPKVALVMKSLANNFFATMADG